jgi:hypothetical protein
MEPAAARKTAGAAAAAVVWFAALAGGAARAQEAAPAGPDSAASGEPAAESVTVPRLFAALDTTATTVGGALTLQLELEPSTGWQVEPPAKSLDLGPFRVRSVERLPRPDGAAWRLRIVAVEAGDVEVPAIRLAARGPEGESGECVTEPIPVHVESNLPSPAPGDEGGEPQEPEPADLKPALAPPRDWRPVAIAAATAALVAALGFWALRRLRGRRRREAPPPPARRVPLRPAWETALEELDRIAAADHVAHGALGLQYVEVTAVLRRYLEERYGVPALERTTSELAESLRRTPLRPDLAARMLALLREADLVKFAKAVPSAADARATEARAREAVLATVPRAAESPGGEEAAA